MTETLATGLDVAAIRARFSALQQGFAFLDAPGGSQVPDEVGDAIARALREASANLGAVYATSHARRGDPRGGRGQGGQVPRLRAARGDLRAEHDLAGLHAVAHRRARTSRPATRSWSPRWTTTAASRRGSSWPATATWSSGTSSCTTTRRSTSTTWRRKLGPRTRVVAFAWASNAVGTIVDARRVCQLAHEAGALAWIDAVHYAAHEPIDVREIGADVLICSPYKFCGPHLGLAYGRAEVIERWRPYKARPRAGLPRSGGGSRPAPSPTSCSPGSARPSTTWTSIGGFAAIVPYERALGRAVPGRASPTRSPCTGCRGWTGRVPTFLVNVEGVPAADVAERLAAAEHRGLGARLVVLAEPVPAPRLRRQVGADRLHPLQHRGRGRPARRGPGRRPPPSPAAPPLLVRRSATRRRRPGSPPACDRLMLPPETTHTILPVPARPDSAAAGASAPAPSAITRTRSASVRTRGRDLVDRDRQRLVDERRDQRPHAVEHPAAAGAVDERGAVVDVDRVPGCQRGGQRGAGGRLGGDDLGLRPQRPASRWRCRRSGRRRRRGSRPRRGRAGPPGSPGRSCRCPPSRPGSCTGCTNRPSTPSTRLVTMMFHQSS